MNILIVDDTPINLKLLRAQLEDEGHAVFEAPNGVDALALLERQRVDVLISDIFMPEMDGYRLCYEIRKHARLHDLPIILCTSTYTSPGDEKLVRDVGANKYLTRPVSLETIIAAVHEVIAMPRIAPQPKGSQEVEVLQTYSERLVSKLEEKNTELMAAEVKFRALVEQSIVGIYIVQDDQFVYVNPGMTGIFGWSEEEMTSRTLSDFVVPQDQALARENIRRRISGEVSSNRYSLRVLHQSGAVLQVEVHSSRADYNGRPAVMGILVDITERKRAQEAAQRSQKRLRDLIDGLGPSLFVGLMTLQGILIEANRPALAAADLKLEDVLGKPFDETYWWSHSPEVQQQLREAIARAARGESSRYDVQARAAENYLIDVDFSLQPLRNETGEVVFLVPSASVITERKQAENALWASEGRLRAIIDNEPECVNLIGKDGLILEMNPAGLRMIEADSLLQAQNKEISRVIVKEHREAFSALLQKTLQGESGILEFDIIGLKGTRRTLDTHAVPLRDERGEVTALLGITRDITKQKRAEALLNGQKRVLEMIAAGAPVGESLTALVRLIEAHSLGMVGSIQLLDEDGVHLRDGASPGLPPEYVTAIDGISIGPSAGSCGTAAYSKEAVMVEDIATDPRWAEYKGVALPYGLRACWSVPIFDAQRRVFGTFAMYYRQPALAQPDHQGLIDIAVHTAAIAIGRHRTETALRTSAERLQFAMQASNVGLWDWNLRTNQVNFSREWKSQLGYEENEIRNEFSEWERLVHPDDLAAAQERVQRYQAQPEGAYEAEFRMRHKGGTWRWIYSRGQFFRDASAEAVRMIGCHIDLTERKQAQEEILRLNAELEERVQRRTAQLQAVNQELEAFSYSVSHDLRAPLSTIDGFSKLLDKEIGVSAASARSRHYLSRIRTGVVQMGELIDALLSLAHVSQTSLRWESVDLSSIAETVLNGYRERDPGRVAQLVIEPGLVVHGDPRLLRQVLDNLLGNAWKFSGQQPQTHISFGRESGPDDKAMYVVRDNGAGFDMAYSEKLFGAFQRLHTLSEFAGTGIGLATAYRIVTRHGGRIWAESAPGQGATFYFTLGQAMA